MAYNKVWFHAGAPCNGCAGIGEMWRKLDAAGVPFGVYSVDGGGLVAVDAAQYEMAETLIYRSTRWDYVPYHVEATAERAVAYWREIAAALPREVRAAKDRVWIEVFNEPDKERTEIVARWQYQLALAAVADGYRFCGPGWASGTPEPEAWREPWMRKYLELCAAQPNRVALTLHEYSYDADDIQVGYPYLVGRYKFVHEACAAMGIPRPVIFITETGWTLDDMPDVVQAIDDVAFLAREYGRHRNIKAAFLWTLIGGGDKKQLAADLNRLIAPIGEYALTARFEEQPGPTPTPPPAEPPKPDPAPQPPPTAVNLLANASWEEGHYHPDDTNGYPIAELQVPTGWTINYRETTAAGWPNPFDPAPFARPEMRRLPASQLPPDEQIGGEDALILHGEHTLKIFKGGAPLYFTLSTRVPAGSGPRRLKLAVPVFPDLVKGYTPKPNKKKIWADDAGKRDGLFRVRMNATNLTTGRPEWQSVYGGGWEALVPGKWQTLQVTFDAPATPFDLKLDFLLPFGLPQNGLFLDDLALIEVAVPQPPPPPPDPKPEPPPPPPTPERPVLVLDLSKWNWPPDFAKMTAAGVDGLILRASYGTTRDERLDEFMARHKAAAGAPPVIAFYHYYHPWQPWRPQLDTLLAAMRQHGIGWGALDLEDMRFESAAVAAQEGLELLRSEEDLPPSVRRRMNERAMREMGIDPDATDDDSLFYERPGAGVLEAAPAAVQPKLVEDARQFMAALRAEMPLAGYAQHLIYSNWAYWSSVMGRPAWGAEYGLWIAAWTTAARPAVPPPWGGWTFWQYTSDGDGKAHGVGSARVDLNRFIDDRAAFRLWVAQTTKPPATVPLANALWVRGAAEPSLTWNPAFALAGAILADGYHIISGEYELTHGGATYRCQNAADNAGKRRVYYCVVPKWSEVKWIAGPASTPPGTGSPPPPPPPPSGPKVVKVDLTNAFRPIRTTGEARGPFMVYQHADGRTEDAQYLVQGDEVYLIKGSNYEGFKVRNGGVYRYEDTSHGNDTYYELRDDPERPGSLWLPLEMEIGRPYRRAPWVTFYRKADCRAYDGPRQHVTWALIDAVYLEVILPGGLKARNVIDLCVADAASEKDVKGRWFERYWYALGTAGADGRADVRGLVQWWARNDKGQIVANSWLVDLPQGRAPLPLTRPKCLEVK